MILVGFKDYIAMNNNGYAGGVVVTWKKDTVNVRLWKKTISISIWM